MTSLDLVLITGNSHRTNQEEGSMNTNQCDAKVLYDTEFEAEVASSKVGHKFNTEMVPYKCGSHWHIGNVDTSMRSKNRTFDKMYCDACETYMKKKQWVKHIETWHHQKRERDLNRSPSTS